ncbi:MAG: hypothetical protein CVU56_16045 [Deltaproteobacteria bacterium HGW-Deltaproteobacteria-14]|jgi:hypothetical protein|nr:MAG: hypothetical protein CVU56_16045 [Deltaproteobacteria bacterium HGW-Deltaproteobacteria-14]
MVSLKNPHPPVRTAGDDLSSACAEARKHLALLRIALESQADPVQLHIDAAMHAVETIEYGIDDSFCAMRQIADAVALAPPGASDRRLREIEEALADARDSVDAVMTARDVAAARHAEALAKRDRVIANMHEELATLHAEVMALGVERDAAWSGRGARGGADHVEALMARRDHVINDMHHEIADVHAEALTLEMERDQARERIAALEDATRLLELDLEATRAERERYRDRLRDAVDAARTGRAAELAGGWMPLTGRLDRPGGRRVARTTTELVRRAAAPPLVSAGDDVTTA